jgi:hypothetical protein
MPQAKLQSLVSATKFSLPFFYTVAAVNAALKRRQLEQVLVAWSPAESRPRKNVKIVFGEGVFLGSAKKTRKSWFWWLGFQLLNGYFFSLNINLTKTPFAIHNAAAVVSRFLLQACFAAVVWSIPLEERAPSQQQRAAVVAVVNLLKLLEATPDCSSFPRGPPWYLGLCCQG